MVAKRRAITPVQRLFDEIASGIEAMRDHREGRLELRRHRIEPAKVYQLKVTLMETDPPIWRRLSVPGNTTLSRLAGHEDVDRKHDRRPLRSGCL